MLATRRSKKSSPPPADAMIASHPLADLFALRLSAIWSALKSEHISFWAICGYLIVEYVRPQSILPSLNVLPWAQTFILLSTLSWIADKNRRWVKDPANTWMSIFLVVLILAGLTAYWPEISRKYFMNFFGWFVIYFLIINIVNNEKRFFIFLLIFLIASFKLAQFGARTWAMRGFSFTKWGLMGPEGFFQNSGELAIQMLVYTAISYQFALAFRPWLSPLKYYLVQVGTLFGAMTILGSSTRGGQLGLAIESYFTFLKGKLTLKTVLVVALISCAGWLALPAEQKDRISHAGEDDTSRQRLLYWKRGIEMIEQHPVLGIGYFNFPQYFEVHYPQDKLYKFAELPHNIFIQVGTDAGLLGIFVYLMLIYRTFRTTKDIRKIVEKSPDCVVYATLSRGFDTAFVGFLVAGQFVSVVYYPFMWVHLALVVSLKHLLLAKLDPQSTQQRPGAAHRIRSQTQSKAAATTL